jgi:DNA repair protein RadC
MNNKNMKEISSAQEQLLYGHLTNLSNLDLMSALLGCPQKAQMVIAACPMMTALEDASVTDLLAIPTINEVDVGRLVASRELSRRRSCENGRRGTPITDCQAAFEAIAPQLRGEKREVVLALALDTKARLICPPLLISIGTLNHALIHPRELFRPLIKLAAYSCVLAHFHPSSGEATPSPEDLELTARLRDAGELLGIPINDHLVIGDGYFVSLAERLLM